MIGRSRPAPRDLAEAAADECRGRAGEHVPRSAADVGIDRVRLDRACSGAARAASIAPVISAAMTPRWR
jgi:hypothetical protein